MIHLKVSTCVLLISLCLGGIFPENHVNGVIPLSGYDDIFYWLFFSRRDIQDPLIIWVGGPTGFASEIDLFYASGPFRLNRDQVESNQFSWNSFANVVYVDFPSRNGFSQGDVNNLSIDENKVAEYFGEFLLSFYQAYP